MPFHRREVDDETVIDGPETGSVVTATSNGDGQSIRSSECDRRHDVRHVAAARDQARVPVDHAVVDPTGRVVLGVAGADDLATKRRSESVDGGFLQSSAPAPVASRVSSRPPVDCGVSSEPSATWTERYRGAVSEALGLTLRPERPCPGEEGSRVVQVRHHGRRVEARGRWAEQERSHPGRRPAEARAGRDSWPPAARAHARPGSARHRPLADRQLGLAVAGGLRE